MNSYLIECDDFIACEKEVNRIIESNKFTSFSKSIYDMEETPLENALEDLDTYSLLSDKKVIIVKNIEVLKYDDFKKDFDHLFKYIDNPKEDNLLIILSRKLNNTLKVTKELKNKCKYISIDINTKSYIKNELNGYKISKEAIDLLDDYCLGDITKITNECHKLRDYKYDSKTIDVNDIKNLVQRKLKDSQDLIFSFTRSIAEKDKKSALEKYKELLNYNFEPLSIIGLLGSQIRIIYQVKLLEKQNMFIKDIALTLSEKEFRIKKTKELVDLYTEKELLDLMIKLGDIDLKIKTTDTNPNNEIELFILNLK